MKKILLIFLSLLLSLAQAKNYQDFCSTNIPKKTLKGNLMSITGFNSLTRNIIESAISHSVKKETGAKFNIKMNNFYGVNLLNGEFKSLSAKAKKYQADGIFLSDINVQTICPYNHISYSNDEINFRKNLVLKYSANLTQDDLNKIISSSDYQKMLDKMNNDKTISSLIQIKNSNVLINNDKLIFKYEVLPLYGVNLSSFLGKKQKTISLNFTAGLEVKNGKVQICNFKFNSKGANSKIFSSLVNKLNPTTWQIDVDKNKKGDLVVENVKIANSKIYFDGYILILQDKLQ